MAVSTHYRISCDQPPDDDDGRSPQHAHRCLHPGKRLRAVSQASLQSAPGPARVSAAAQLSDGGRAYPGCARRLGVQHEAVNVSTGGRSAGSKHIQAVNHRHPQRKAFLGPFRRVATKFLDSYLRWFRQVGFVREACHRRCLVASTAANAYGSLIEPFDNPPGVFCDQGLRREGRPRAPAGTRCAEGRSCLRE